MCRVYNILFSFSLFSCMSLTTGASTLYGISRSTSPQVVGIEPKTYQVTPIGEALIDFPPLSTMSLDQQNGIYYFVAIDINGTRYSNLIGLSVENGSLITEVESIPSVSDWFGGYNILVNVDSNTDDVYVTGGEHISLGETILNVVRVNPTLGTQTNVIRLPKGMHSGDLSAFDPIRNVLYVEVKDSSSPYAEYYMIAIDVKAGKVLEKFEKPKNLKSMVYDAVTDKMYGMANLSKENPSLISLNLETRVFSQVALIPLNEDFVSADYTALDMKSRTFAAMANVMEDVRQWDLLTIDIDSGALLSYARVHGELGQKAPYGIGYRM